MSTRTETHRLKPEALLGELEAVAEKLAIKVSYEALSAAIGAGGLCRVKGQYRVIIDKRASTGDRVTTLAQALGQVGVGDVALSPSVRDLVALHAVRRAS